MDVKQRLRAYLDLSETLKVTDGPVPIMQAALEEIERLEQQRPSPTGELSDSQRIARLETLMCMLARGLLLHEYAKDFHRYGTEAACKELANNQDLSAALIALAT